jgi:Tfp pilus assembly protein FimT
VVLVIFAIAAMAIPGFISMARSLRIGGDARDINGEVALVKIRAAADFTQARLYADLAAQNFHIETWTKPIPPATNGSWATEGATQSLSQGVTFGFGAIGTPPAGTQAAIGEAPACRNDTGASPGTGNAIANTACIIFNSRGIPVDSTGTPTANDALYVTDGSSVYAATVSATGVIRTWRTDASAAGWMKR